MNILKKQIFAVSILILMMSLALALCAQPVTALDYNSASYIFITAPSQVGINQEFSVVFFMSSVTPDAMLATGSRWKGITVAITKPDNTTESRGPFTLDAVASSYFTYVPTQIGDYKFQASFPGQTIPPYFSFFVGMTNYNTTFLPSKSQVITVSVTESPAPSPHDVPLPTEYWTRPISALSANWWTISSNWLMPGWDTMDRQFDQGSAYDPYTTAPNSAHVLWTKPLTFGGLTGGEFGGVGFHTGSSYEQFFKPPVIIGGRLYYNTIVGEEPTATSTGVNSYTSVHYEDFSSITCVDMDTGETLFTIPNASLAFGQIYSFISPNQGGTFAYLWDIHGPNNTWKMYDAWTGQYMLSLSNVPSGTIKLSNTFGGPGDILIYSVDSTGTLSLWNSSRTFIPSNPSWNYWTWRPENFLGKTLNATGNTTMTVSGYADTVWDTNGTMWKVKLANYPAGASIQQIGHDNKIWVMAGSGTGGAAFAAAPRQTWASYNMQTGALMSGPTTIDLTTKIPANTSAYYGVSQPIIISSGGILPLFVKETLQYFAWDLNTGALAWGPTTAYTNGWALFNWETQFIVNDILYNWGFDGKIHAFDVKTGKELWAFSSGDAGSVTPYGTWPFYQGLTVADGKIFAQTGDHGNGAQPLYQGEGVYAIDAKTGAHIWNLTGWFMQPAIADGKYVTQNLYDNQIYCFAKGPTTTTITAPMTAVTEGDEALLQGTVIDTSPGTTQYGLTKRFPDGLAAVSETDMKAWMEYVYEYQSLGHIVSGVPVSIDAVDPNNNFIHIGDATSDGTGQFGFKWETPLVPGMYTIVTTFAGSASYYPSHAETHMIVSAAPAPTAPPEYPQPIDNTLTIIAMGIVLLIAIVIVGVLLLRKK